jgi:hypothetical protein
MEIKFDVKIRTRDMFQFMIYHTYSSFSGKIGIFLSVAAIILCIYTFGKVDATRTVLLLLIGLLFTVINPVLLYTRSKKQILMNPMYKKPLSYTLNEEGITVSQDEEKSEMKWENVAKAVSTRDCLIIYVNQINAFILPIECIGAEYDNVVKLIGQKVDKKRIKWKARIK